MFSSATCTLLLDTGEARRGCEQMGTILYSSDLQNRARQTIDLGFDRRWRAPGIQCEVADRRNYGTYVRSLDCS